jgi:hypothetical protein
MSKGSPNIVELPPSLTEACRRSEVDKRIHAWDDSLSTTPSPPERSVSDGVDSASNAISSLHLGGFPRHVGQVFSIWVSETPTARGKSFLLSLSPSQVFRCMLTCKTLYKLLSNKDAIFWVSYLGYTFHGNKCPDAINPIQVYRQLLAQVKAPTWENSR